MTRALEMELEGNVRLEKRLRLKISEAKNLSFHSPVSSQDTFCMVSLDQEQIFRTAIHEKSNNPFYAEEFECRVPRSFRYLSLYVYHRERFPRRDIPIGKVSIRREELSQHHGRDTWFFLTPVDADSEIHGKVRLEISFNNKKLTDPTSVGAYRMKARVRSCNDLTIINDQCDPYATVTLSSPTRSVQKKRTKVCKENNNPHFEEEFSFELPDNADMPRHSFPIGSQNDISQTQLKVNLYSQGRFGDAFIGGVKIPITSLDPCKVHDAWYVLRPRCNSSGVQRTNNRVNSSIRIGITYNEDYVLPAHYYENLINIILKSTTILPISSSPACVLADVVPDKRDIAKPLVKIFLHNNKFVNLVKALASAESSGTTDVNTLFRGNSLLTKSIDEFMKIAGSRYLIETLKPVIDEIFNEKKSCEIDTSKLKPSESLSHNLENLYGYCKQLLSMILYSSLSCPRRMCEVFYTLKDAAIQNIPDCKDVRYIAVSGFVFLRFFAPAILAPKLFQIRSDNPDRVVDRTLKLVSKAVQSLGNQVTSSAKSGSFKEDFMSQLMSKLADKDTLERLRKFLDIISSADRAHVQNIEAPIVLKEGVMTKRAQGRKKLGVKNFKKRYFCLTTKELYYAKMKERRKPLCNIAISDIRAVERLEENSFKMNFMFQVVQPERALYIQANNCVEEKEWIDILTKICENNSNRLDMYHPAAYVNGCWQCCRNSQDGATGCAPVSPMIMMSSDMALDIDSSYECQKINSLLLANLDKLDKLQCDCGAVYTGSSQHGNCKIVEEPKSCFGTIKMIQKEVSDLDSIIQEYIRKQQENMKIGSEEMPIDYDSGVEHLSASVTSDD